MTSMSIPEGGSDGKKTVGLKDVHDWSELLWELLVDVSRRLQLVEDFTAFRYVCNSWRAAVPKSIFGKSGSLPLLMLAEKANSDGRELYSTSKKKICGTLSLPKLQGRRCLGARFGWLVTVAYDGEMSLLNPISGAHIQLPNFRTFPNYYERRHNPEYGCIQRVMLSADPSNDSSNYILIAVAYQKLGFWRQGYESWKWVEGTSRVRKPIFHNLGHCDGKFYAIDLRGQVWALDPCTFNDDGAHIITKVHCDYIGCRTLYLVESSDKELILVSRDGTYIGDNITYGTFHFDLIKIDVTKGEWELMSGLDKDAIFIGFNYPFCVQPFSVDDVIKHNHIYFTDDCASVHYARQRYGLEAGGKDMGVYSIQDQTIEPFNTLDSLSYVSPPMWVDSSILIKD